ncbi:conserved hypothetical protein [Ricinus communis]|uniref:Uncharacterized protein n=1 Tax=Ricinus communis TaxID=3988 RepID=B9T893_RICCO|nr:conserved hypothetical protein [Ricinus communis]
MENVIENEMVILFSPKLANKKESHLSYLATMWWRKGDTWVYLVSWEIEKGGDRNAIRSCMEETKYYPRTESLKASRGDFTWQNILIGKDLVRRCLRWRIGNGHNIHMFDVGWLPRPDTFKVRSQANGLDKNIFVRDLMNEMGIV